MVNLAHVEVCMVPTSELRVLVDELRGDGPGMAVIMAELKRRGPVAWGPRGDVERAFKTYLKSRKGVSSR